MPASAAPLINNFQNWGKKRPEGASTITQQVAKNFLLSSEQKLDRKLKEAILAIRIERAYSKDKILELYLNEIYLGIGSYGVAAAALNYFSKELSELSIEEAAYLAALPKAPNNYHPFRKTREATVRRNWIIDQMAEVGYISGEQAKVGQGQALNGQYSPVRHADLRGRLFRRRGAPPADGDGRRGWPLRARRAHRDRRWQRQRWPFRQNHARSRNCSARHARR